MKEPRYNYYTITFQQGEDAEEPLRLLDTEGPDAAIDYLSQWDFGGDSEHCMSGSFNVPYGTADDKHKRGLYTLTWNAGLGYIALTRAKKGRLFGSE